MLGHLSLLCAANPTNPPTMKVNLETECKIKGQLKKEAEVFNLVSFACWTKRV